MHYSRQDFLKVAVASLPAQGASWVYPTRHTPH